MAASPIWKVYDATGKYQAACHEPEAAACLANVYGEGMTIRYDHSLVMWREGQEEWSAGDSYDRTASLLYERLGSENRKRYAAAHGARS